MYDVDLEPSFMKIDEKYIGYIKIKVSTDIINDKQQIILIIDNSYSMNGDRIKYVIEAYTNLLNKIKNENIYITLITFNHETKILYENIIITDDNINLYIDILKNISVNGGTLISPSIQLALTKKKENYNCNIIIFTDGEDDELLSHKNKIYDLFTNETLHICGIGSDSIKLVNNLAECAKIKTINIIDNLNVINSIFNNLINYMNNNINDTIIINNNYYQLLNNQIKLIPLDPIDNINDFKINFTIRNSNITTNNFKFNTLDTIINLKINIKISNDNIKIIFEDVSNKLFDINCIETELERLNIKFNIIMSNEIITNNVEKLNNIIDEYNNYLQKLNDICDINSIIITELNNYNKYINDIAYYKNIIDDIDNIDNYSLSDIANRSLSNAITVRSLSLIY